MEEFGTFAMDFQEEEGLGWGTVYSSNNHNNTFTFKKSSFYFDDIIVCLGSGINNNDSSNPTVTTLYQRLYDPGVEVTVNNVVEGGTGTTSFGGSNDNWVLSNYGTGFYIVQGNHTLKIKKDDQQTPNQNQTNPGDYVNNDTATYCVGYIDHGTSPSNEAYEYIIKPGTNAATMQTLDDSIQNGNKPYIVYQKDQTAHIVEYLEEDVWGYALFDTVSNLNYSHVKGSDLACLIMHKYDSTNHTMTLSITNPDIGFDSRSYNAAIPKTIQLTLHNEWFLQTSYPNTSLVFADSNSTVVSFNTLDGLAIEVVLVRGNPSCPLSQVGTICDDGDSCSINDVYDEDCNCVGTIQDADKRWRLRCQRSMPWI